MGMKLTSAEQAILDGSEGDVKAKIMRTLVLYGEAFGAEKFVPVTSEKGHLVTSFGLGVMSPVYDLMDDILNSGVKSAQPFTVDPKPLDSKVPANLIQKIFFKVMYKKQDFYDDQLKRLGIEDSNSYSCTCYMPEMGNVPNKGEVLSWAESSAVVYANSVLGAKCNRNSGIIELFGSIMGIVPYFGLLDDANRKATWIIDVQTTKKPEAQVLGSAIGMKVMEDVPYIKGLDKWIGTDLNQETKDYLKDMGAATASNGAVGLYHVANLTPEAVELGEGIIEEGAEVYVIDDAELERVKAGYPVIWEDPNARPKLCFVGCPHLSLSQAKDWTEKLSASLKAAGKSKVAIKSVFTMAPKVLDEFKKTEEYSRLSNMGVIISYICPLMYMNNPKCKTMPVITNSNKLRTYTSSRYHTDDEILRQLSGEVL